MSPEDADFAELWSKLIIRIAPTLNNVLFRLEPEVRQRLLDSSDDVRDECIESFDVPSNYVLTFAFHGYFAKALGWKAADIRRSLKHRPSSHDEVESETVDLSDYSHRKRSILDVLFRECKNGTWQCSHHASVLIFERQLAAIATEKASRAGEICFEIFDLPTGTSKSEYVENLETWIDCELPLVFPPSEIGSVWNHFASLVDDPARTDNVDDKLLVEAVSMAAGAARPVLIPNTLVLRRVRTRERIRNVLPPKDHNLFFLLRAAAD